MNVQQLTILDVEIVNVVKTGFLFMATAVALCMAFIFHKRITCIPWLGNPNIVFVVGIVLIASSILADEYYQRKTPVECQYDFQVNGEFERHLAIKGNELCLEPGTKVLRIVYEDRHSEFYLPTNLLD